jgi:hypothetical protein
VVIKEKGRRKKRKEGRKGEAMGYIRQAHLSILRTNQYGDSTKKYGGGGNDGARTLGAVRNGDVRDGNLPRCSLAR